MHTNTTRHKNVNLTWTLSILSWTILSLSSSLLLSVDNCNLPTRFTFPRFCSFPFLLWKQTCKLNYRTHNFSFKSWVICLTYTEWVTILGCLKRCFTFTFLRGYVLQILLLLQKPECVYIVIQSISLQFPYTEYIMTMIFYTHIIPWTHFVFQNAN